MLALLDGLFNGISIGSVLLIAALGLAIVFGLMGVINLAHGELMMLGAYTTFVVQNGFKMLGESGASYYIWFALPAAFIVAALVGLALERGVIRFLYGRPLETLLATWGVSLILRQFVRSVNWVMIIGIVLFCLLFFGAISILSRRQNWQEIRTWATTTIFTLSTGITVAVGMLLFKSGQKAIAKPWFGTTNVSVSSPKWLNEPITIGEFVLPSSRLFIIGLTIVCILGIYWFLQGSKWGLRIRAVTQNRSMSSCLGIPTQKVDALTFALGSGLAGIAGCAITLLGAVGPNIGQNYIVDAFMVVVVGGVGNLLGTILAALVIGLVSYLFSSQTLVLLLTPVESLKPLVDILTFFSTSTMARVMVFALIIAFLQVKPSGIFPQKGRMVDA